MAYTSNPYVPKARRLAVNDVIVRKLKVSLVSRKYGVHRSTVYSWIKKASPNHREYIQTLSSAPKSHPNQLSMELVEKVIEFRKRYNRCAPIVHRRMLNAGYSVSLSSVERILRRKKLTKPRKQFKPPYGKIKRPKPKAPGDLVQIDTIHFVKSNGVRFFVYAVIDLYSRMGYVEYSSYVSSRRSFEVIKNALDYLPFKFKTVQADNGSEFSENLYINLKEVGIKFRHTRVRRPNDNAHVERFIRTIQEEGKISPIVREKEVRKRLKWFLTYYNYERLHLALQCKTPAESVVKVLK